MTPEMADVLKAAVNAVLLLGVFWIVAWWSR
jgi:hypothetical protein